mmetsp:Transcript_42308/g.70616  ORF Transcript_42308/g.70616 Transcript_42308/m.70616 type:complete len:174 (+) Transcript_42308:212-733(+)|eukprot:CAMPEP_0198215140 /NCGR_PEP_ID=MMETSP1445-20131203/47365_1 /TAXON_ID=36898 /ORGANISM="Pyramimonas sp., Strain CCMP2087" /LENGTH=173 /DNA_ID=CAMNT_0043890711 /DNA_START=210 /DNA_END=731 /DNA_ORIENTATION=+
MAEEEGKAVLGFATGMVAAFAMGSLSMEAWKTWFTAECKTCSGTGLATCKKCKGYGFLRIASQGSTKAFASANDDLDNLQVCTFCNKYPGKQGCFQCTACKGAARYQLDRPNYEKLWKWHEPHWNALQRYNFRENIDTETVRTKETKKLLDSGLGGFALSGSANALPFPEDEV